MNPGESRPPTPRPSRCLAGCSSIQHAVFDVTDEVVVAKDNTENILGPGTITGKDSFVCVQIVDRAHGGIKLHGLLEEGHVTLSPGSEMLKTEPYLGVFYKHMIEISTVTRGRTRRHCLSVVSTKPKHNIGETLHFAFGKNCPGLPCFYTVKLDFNGGELHHVQASQLELMEDYVQRMKEVQQAAAVAKAQRREDNEQKRKARKEAEAQKKAEEEQQKMEVEAQKKAEDKRQKMEAEAQQKAEEERQRSEQEIAKKRLQEEELAKVRRRQQEKEAEKKRDADQAEQAEAKMTARIEGAVLRGSCPVFGINDSVVMRWTNVVNGERCLWPGKVIGMKPFIRVEVVDDSKNLKLVDMWEHGYLVLAEDKKRLVTTVTEMDGELAYRHEANFQTFSKTATTTWTLSITNQKREYCTGERLTFIFNRAVTGLPSFYTVDFHGEAGIREDLEQHMLLRATSEDVAPEAVPWPPCGRCSGNASAGMFGSKIRVRNMHPSSSGLALFVKVCKQEDADAINPQAVATLFVHPGETSPIDSSAELQAGLYHMRIAVGHKLLACSPNEAVDRYGRFYGETYLFGPAGTYLKDERREPTFLNLNQILTLQYPQAGGSLLYPIDQMHF